MKHVIYDSGITNDHQCRDSVNQRLRGTHWLCQLIHYFKKPGAVSRGISFLLSRYFFGKNLRDNKIDLTRAKWRKWNAIRDLYWIVLFQILWFKNSITHWKSPPPFQNFRRLPDHLFERKLMTLVSSKSIVSSQYPSFPPSFWNLLDNNSFMQPFPD
jgi:hypothetical protein